MQKIEIIGNLGGNCARRNGADGKQYLAFQVAVTNAKGATTWYGCITPLRERIEQYLVKGTKVYVRGDLNINAHTLSDGRQVVDTDIFAKELELVGVKQDATQEESNAVQDDPFA